MTLVERGEQGGELGEEKRTLLKPSEGLETASGLKKMLTLNEPEPADGSRRKLVDTLYNSRHIIFCLKR